MKVLIKLLYLNLFKHSPQFYIYFSSKYIEISLNLNKRHQAKLSKVDAWSQTLLFTGKASFSSPFFLHSRHSTIIQNRLNTSLIRAEQRFKNISRPFVKLSINIANFQVITKKWWLQQNLNGWMPKFSIVQTLLSRYLVPLVPTQQVLSRNFFYPASPWEPQKGPGWIDSIINKTSGSVTLFDLSSASGHKLRKSS